MSCYRDYPGPYSTEPGTQPPRLESPVCRSAPRAIPDLSARRPMRGWREGVVDARPVRARYAHAVICCAVHPIQAPPAAAACRPERGAGHRGLAARHESGAGGPGGHATRVPRDRPQPHRTPDQTGSTRSTRAGRWAGLITGDQLARIEGQTVTPIAGNGSGLHHRDQRQRDDRRPAERPCDPRRRHDRHDRCPAFGGHQRVRDRDRPAGTTIVGASYMATATRSPGSMTAARRTPLPALDVDYPNAYAVKINSSGLIAGTVSKPGTGRDRGS